MTVPRTSGLRQRLADHTQGSASLGRRAALMAGVGLLAVTTSAQAEVGRLSASDRPTVGEPAVVQPPVSLPANSARLQVGEVAATPLAGRAGGAGDIPAVATSAYQRAATVIDQADPTCHLSWALLAGLGRVESDHGRVQGNALDASGIAVPGILGPELDGRHGTARVLDTDAGALDGDQRFDRALGPFLFLPATWREVEVDADGDGRRDPQDINDAALAAAVYLCSGSGDLSRPAPQRAAVLRLVRDRRVASAVLADARAYADAGTPASVPLLTAQPLVARPPAGPVHTALTGASAAGHEHATAPASDGGHSGSHQPTPHPHPTHGGTATPSAPPPPTLAGCEAAILPESVSSLLGGDLGGTLAQVVSVVRVVPLVGPRLAAALTRCVQPTDG